MLRVKHTTVADSAVDYTAIRPPTEAFHNREAAARWRAEFLPATAYQRPSVRLVNLGGATAFELGAISELLVPVMAGIARGAYGRFALVVSGSDYWLEPWLRSVAADAGAPVFFSRSLDDIPRAVGAETSLTPAELETLNVVVALGGKATAADVAKARGLDHAAANNRLANLERKRFLFRVSRTRPHGDWFIDPGSAPRHSAAAGVEEAVEIQIPDEIRDAVAELARQQNRPPEDLLAEAWVTYFEQNREALNASVRHAQELLRNAANSDDEEDDPTLQQWADEAAAKVRI